MIFVTGASGFIGKYIVKRLLERKQQIIVLVRDQKRYERIGDELIIESDLEQLSSLVMQLSQYSIDTCLHLAWEGIPDYSYLLSKKNFSYGLAILELCQKLHILQLIITGSCWEYENPVGMVSETSDISYANFFKASKSSLRMFAEIFCKNYGIQLNWLRLFYVYGVGQKSESLLPYVIGSFLHGSQPQLNGAYNRNDFIYVSDVAEAIVMCVEQKPKTVVMNVGSGQATEVLNIVKLVANRLGIRDLDVSKYKKSKDRTDFCADIQIIKRELGWSPTVKLENGINAMIESITLQGKETK